MGKKNENPVEEIVDPKPPTAVSKTIKTTLWVAASAAISAGIVALQSAIGNGDFNEASFAAYLPFVNIGLVFLKNLVDPNVKNV
jgi:hypothetical protein